MQPRPAVAAAMLALLGAGCATDDTTSPTTSTPPPANDTPAEDVDAGQGDDVSQGLGSRDASGDVSDVRIEWGSGAYTLHEVVAVVTNNSEKRSDYAIDVAIESPDGSVRHDQVFLWVENLEPGQMTEVRSSFDDAPEGAVPVVKTVQRTASL